MQLESNLARKHRRILFFKRFNFNSKALDAGVVHLAETSLFAVTHCDDSVLMTNQLVIVLPHGALETRQ